MKAAFLFSLVGTVGLAATTGFASDSDHGKGDMIPYSHSGSSIGQHQIVYAPTQYYRNGSSTICYGYKELGKVAQFKHVRGAWSSAPETSYIFADSTVPANILSKWRRVVSSEAVADGTAPVPARSKKHASSAVTYVENAPTAAGRETEPQADAAPSGEEQPSKAGRINPIEMLDEQIQREPENINAYYTRASLYHEMRDFLRAIDDYSQVIQLDPNNVNAFYKRGLCYTAMGRSDLAVADLRRANQVAPEDNRAWFQQSGSWIRQHGF